MVKQGSYAVLLIAALIMTGCPTYTMDVPEDEMDEYELLVRNVFFIENTGEFRIDYDIIGYGGKLYEDYKGHAAFNFINYITNLSASDFSPAESDGQFRSIYTKGKSSLPATVTFNTGKMIYIYTEEEVGGGIPGLYEGEDWTATAKARIKTTLAPVMILNSADSLISLNATETIPEPPRTYDSLAYADEDLVIINTSVGYSGYGAWAYHTDSDTWTKIFPAYVRHVVKAADTHFCYCDGAFYASTDKGRTWMAKGFSAPADFTLQAFSAEDTMMAAYYMNRDNEQVLLVSTDSGDHWTSCPSFPLWLDDLSILNGVIFSNTGTFIYSSADYGNTWTKYGIEPSFATMVNSGNNLYVRTRTSVQRFTNRLFTPLNLPTGDYVDYYAASGNRFAYFFEKDTGCCINLNIVDDGPWYFLTKDVRDIDSFQVLENRMLFVNGNTLEIYKINT